MSILDPDSAAACMVFDAMQPMGITVDEHIGGGFRCEESRARSADGVGPRGFEGYLLELADLCKGFRVVVAGPLVATILEAYSKHVKFSRAIEAAQLLTCVGTWRGYDFWVDPTLDTVDPAGSSGRLAVNVSAKPLGLFRVLNWGEKARYVP